MTSIHEPTPEFERFLEWQVTSALRRQDRFTQPARTGPRRYLSAAATVVVALLVGAAAGAAPGRIQDNQQKALLLQQQQSELQLAQMQAAIAEKSAKGVKLRVEIGVAGQDAVEAADRDLQEAQLKLQRIQLNIDEVQRSGRAVQDELTSPLVGGRDFVVDRLKLDQLFAGMRVAASERRVHGLQRRYDTGLANQIELAEAQAGFVRAAGEMKGAGERIALRQRFLSGGITAQDATRQRLLILARIELQAATSNLDVASSRYANLQKQVQVGNASEMDMLKAQLEMLSRKQDVERLQARIAELEKGRSE